MSIIIAIDGFSSTGKSTLARDLAARIDFGYVDTGAMYRAVTHYLLERDIRFDDAEAITEALDNIDIQFRPVAGKNATHLNGNNIEEAIRSMRVSKRVSEVAAISAVRRALVEQQQRMGQRRGIVMDGRDIGTVVFPDAELKIFLTADPGKRAQRRYDELRAKGQEVSVQDVVTNLQHRDHIDSTRADSPLRQAPDAVLVDNTNLSREEQLAMLIALARERIGAAS